MKPEEKIIAVDFDGTLVTHEYPEIGAPVPYAFESLRELQERGVKLILWTIRSDTGIHGLKVRDALEFCKKQGIEFWGVNCNPTQRAWSESRKAYAHLYIDDAALGCPLIYPETGRPYADWSKIHVLVLAWLQNGHDPAPIISK